MSTELAPGVRVVCVRGYDGQNNGYGDEVLPKTGIVYTIREIFPLLGQLCVTLNECQNEPRLYFCAEDGGFWFFGEPCFAADRFRPLDERRLDVFRSLLTPVVTREVVTA